MKTKTKKKVKTTPVPVVTPLPPKPDWGNPFHNQQKFFNKVIGGKRGFSGASRKGMGGK